MSKYLVDMYTSLLRTISVEAENEKDAVAAAYWLRLYRARAFEPTLDDIVELECKLCPDTPTDDHPAEVTLMELMKNSKFREYYIQVNYSPEERDEKRRQFDLEYGISERSVENG